MYHSEAVSAGAGGLLVVDRKVTSSQSPIQRGHFGDSPIAHPGAQLSAKSNLSFFTLLMAGILS